MIKIIVPIIFIYSILNWHRTKHIIENTKRVLIKNKNNEITLIMENDIVAKDLAYEMINNFTTFEKLVKYGLCGRLFKIKNKNIEIIDGVIVRRLP